MQLKSLYKVFKECKYSPCYGETMPNTTRYLLAESDEQVLSAYIKTREYKVTEPVSRCCDDHGQVKVVKLCAYEDILIEEVV